MISTAVVVLAISMIVLLPAAYLLGRHLHRRQYLQDELSPVTRQHIDLFQGGQLSEIALETASPSRSIAGNLRAVYAALARRQIVDGREIDLLEHWLEDCETALSGHSTSMSRCP